MLPDEPPFLLSRGLPVAYLHTSILKQHSEIDEFRNCHNTNNEDAKCGQYNKCGQYMSDYLGTDSGGYVCANALSVMIAAWLNASQKSPDCVRLNRSARE